MCISARLETVGFREVLDEAVKGDEVERGVEVVAENIGLNVVVVNAPLLGQFDGVGVGVEAGGLHAWVALAEVRAGSAADVARGLHSYIGTEPPLDIGRAPSAITQTPPVRHSPGHAVPL